MNIFTLLLTQPLANGLILFYRILWNNLGLAIIAFSLFLRFVLNPLTKPYMESMRKMREYAPELEKLKKRHSGDRVKLAQAQADFYKQKGINPGAGCLPYLLQIVVLIAFFNLFTATISPGGNIAERFNKYLYPPLKFTQGESVNTKFLYLDLTKPDSFVIAPLPFPIPGPVLILATLAQIISSRLMMTYTKKEEAVAKKTPQESDDVQVAMQKSMTYTFPLITLLIGIRFPSGLALYWLVFSLSQAYQQISAEKGGLATFFKHPKLLKSDN